MFLNWLLLYLLMLLLLFCVLVFYCKLTSAYQLSSFVVSVAVRLFLLAMQKVLFVAARILYCCYFLFFTVVAVCIFIVIFQGKMPNTLRTVIRVG